jgi:hypothetical protein
MGLGPFTLISLIFVVIGIRSVARMITNWHDVWDRRFTVKDRQHVDEAAFFVLVPVSVALHELGHAIAVWSYGGEVVDFGFYGFAGYVAFIPFGFSDVQLFVVAAAGPLVNLVLSVGALAIVFLKRTPFRAAINELLIQFAIISGANAFIVYPLLDLASGMNGDWRQMYGSGVPLLTAIMVALQVGVIALGYVLYTNDAVKARLARLTDVPAGMERGFLGGLRSGAINLQTLSPRERVLRDASERVQLGWPAKVETGVQRFDTGTAMTLAWRREGRGYAIAARAFASGQADIVTLDTRAAGSRPRRITGWPQTPSADELTVALRIAMESVEQGGA